MIRQLEKVSWQLYEGQIREESGRGRESKKKATEATMRNDESLIQGSETKYGKSKGRIYRTQKLNRCEEYRKRGIKND